MRSDVCETRFGGSATQLSGSGAWSVGLEDSECSLNAEWWMNEARFKFCFLIFVLLSFWLSDCWVIFHLSLLRSLGIFIVAFAINPTSYIRRCHFFFVNFQTLVQAENLLLSCERVWWKQLMMSSSILFIDRHHTRRSKQRLRFFFIHLTWSMGKGKAIALFVYEKVSLLSLIASRCGWALVLLLVRCQSVT